MSRRDTQWGGQSSINQLAFESHSAINMSPKDHLHQTEEGVGFLQPNGTAKEDPKDAKKSNSNGEAGQQGAQWVAFEFGGLFIGCNQFHVWFPGKVTQVLQL